MIADAQTADVAAAASVEHIQQIVVDGQTNRALATRSDPMSIKLEITEIKEKTASLGT